MQDGNRQCQTRTSGATAGLQGGRRKWKAKVGNTHQHFAATAQSVLGPQAEGGGHRDGV